MPDQAFLTGTVGTGYMVSSCWEFGLIDGGTTLFMFFMSYLQAITADTSDECLTQLLQDNMRDQWWSLNDLEQSQLLYEAYQYRQELCDRKAIADLLAVQPRSSFKVDRRSPLPTHPTLHPLLAPLPVNRSPALQMSIFSPPRSSPLLLPDSGVLSISTYRAYTMAEYTRELFKHVATRDDPAPHPRPLIPFELPYFMIEDAHHIAELAGQAYHNRSTSFWNAPTQLCHPLFRTSAMAIA
jgi:hypothetical protein